MQVTAADSNPTKNVVHIGGQYHIAKINAEQKALETHYGNGNKSIIYYANKAGYSAIGRYLLTKEEAEKINAKEIKRAEKIGIFAAMPIESSKRLRKCDISDMDAKLDVLGTQSLSISCLKALIKEYEISIDSDIEEITRILNDPNNINKKAGNDDPAPV